jgi:uncharacterized LabA/DUF88 family protein
MAENPRTNDSLAVLIDADNASAAIVAPLLAEVAKLGTASVKRIYGDWTTPNLASWKQVLLDHSIQPIQQFRYTTGKNATDSAMIIDGMDLLHSRRFTGYCIVSSDSDFTRLAQRIRESGVSVYGFGEQKTPKPFVSACDRFIYTELLRQPATGGTATEPKRRSSKELQGDQELVELLRSVVEEASDESGWAALGGVGSLIGKRASDFDSRRYGYAKLSDLVDAIKMFDVERRDKHIYVRLKKAAAPNA